MGVGDLGTSPPSSSAPVELANSIGSAVGRTYNELFPDLPSEVLGVSVPDTARALADAARPATDAAFQTLPDDAKSGLSDWWQREVDSGFTLVTGNAEYELALALLVFLWATGRPGVFGGAFDAYFANAFDAVLLNKKFDKDSIKIRGKLGDGSFGSVSYAEDTDTGRELVVKQAKSVQGAAQLQNAEEYMNRRVRRAPLVASGCAKYLGSYEVVEGASSPTLVWAFEGDVTLEELIVRRDFPECVEELLYGGAQGGDDYAKRTSKVAKSVLRNLLSTLAGLHDIGTVSYTHLTLPTNREV